VLSVVVDDRQLQGAVEFGEILPVGAVCCRLDWLSIMLDSKANEAGDQIITASGSPVGAYVVPACEDLTMATPARQLLGQRRDGPPGRTSGVR
jgi:hypothetical protein